MGNKGKVKTPRLQYVFDLLSVGLPLDVGLHINYAN